MIGPITHVEEASGDVRPAFKYWDDSKDMELSQESDSESETESDSESEDIVLRDYQEEAVQACVDALKSDYTRIGVSAPTGSGKTIILAALISRIRPIRKQVLILTHSTELVRQAKETVERVHGRTFRVEIEQGAQTTKGKSDV